MIRIQATRPLACNGPDASSAHIEFDRAEGNDYVSVAIIVTKWRPRKRKYEERRLELGMTHKQNLNRLAYEATKVAELI